MFAYQVFKYLKYTTSNTIIKRCKTMIIFSSAVAGSNRSQLEEAVVRLAKKNGKKLKIINFIDEMIKSAEKLNRYITASQLPNLDVKTLEVLKTSAFHRISDEVKSTKNIDYIIDGHTSFWWKGGPINLLNVNDFNEIMPDFFISVTTTPHQVLDSLKSKAEWTDKNIDAYEIAVWSELEVYTTDLISDTIDRKNYLIAASEDPLTLFDLMYSSHKPKVYLSFSMEHRQTGYNDLDRFKSKLKKHSIVFDPRNVDIDAYRNIDDDRIRELVFNQTVRRDYHLIDQSDLVVIHLSALVYSSGVDSERMHAHTTGKKVLLYFPFERYSPFTPYFVDKMYKDEDNLLNDVRKLSADNLNKQRVSKR